MGRKANDGRGRLGGRTVGTKNKPLPPVGEWVENLLNKHRVEVETVLTSTDAEAKTPVLAALLVVSALNRATTAVKVATGLLPQPADE